MAFLPDPRDPFDERFEPGAGGPADRLIGGRYDPALLGREKTVRGRFVQDVLGAETLTDDVKRQILLVGLLALDGADDLEVR
jgi:hypothetical protein